MTNSGPGVKNPPGPLLAHKGVDDTNLNMYLSKKKSTGKIDMLMATVDAVYLLRQDMLFGRDVLVAQT